MSRHRVVIIGSGFGGLTAAKALKRADADITLTTTNTTNPIRIHCSGVGDFQLIRHPLPLMYPLT